MAEFSLAHQLEDSFEYNGNVFHVDMAFDNILRLFEMFDDDTIIDYEKVFLALEILINEYQLLKDRPFQEQLEIYKFLMKEFLDIDLERQETEEQKKIMNFQKDAGLIYASFLHAYNIDLFELQGKLHWYKFSNLLVHLPDKTAFKEVVGYRTMKIPTGNTVSKEYKEHVLRMKRIYALEEQSVETFDQKMNALAQAMKGG